MKHKEYLLLKLKTAKGYLGRLAYKIITEERMDVCIKINGVTQERIVMTGNGEGKEHENTLWVAKDEALTITGTKKAKDTELFINIHLTNY